MYRFVFLSALFCIWVVLIIFSTSSYAQVEPRFSVDGADGQTRIREDIYRKDRRQFRGNPHENEHRLKMGERDISIRTADGTTPTELQIESIKNVLKEDFLVNDDTTGSTSHWIPSIAIDGSGNFVIAWEDYRNGNYDIYFQRYNASGTAQGVNAKVNDDIGTNLQHDPSVAMNVNGNFVIVWGDERNGNKDIYFQRYNSIGTVQGVNAKANDDAATAQQWAPTIVIDNIGNFVITWEDWRNVSSDIYYQRYNSNGAALGVNTIANDDAGSAYQGRPFIAMDASGNFVIAWIDLRNGNKDIYYRRFNSIGAAQGISSKVNDDVGTANQLIPSIAMDGSGNYVIAWADERNYNFDIYFQRYNSIGTPQGVNRKANDDAGTAYQWLPSIAMDGSGNFVIAWGDARNGNFDIYYQRYNTSGTAQGVNTKANDDVGTTWQWYPSIAMDGSGNFVIAWGDARNGNSDIYYQRYNTSGTAQGVNIKANDDAGIAQQSQPFLAMDVSGNFIIAWEDFRIYYPDIYYQRYNSSGAAQGVNRKVNDDAGSAFQWEPSVAMDGSGNFVIVWEDNRNGNYDIYFQRYNSSGAAQGVNTKANDDAGTAKQLYPSITMAGSGNFVIAWADERSGNSDIYYQRYNSSGAAQGVNSKVNDDVGTAGQWFPSVAMDSSGNFVIVWEDYRYGSSAPDVIGQRFYADGSLRGTNYRIVADGPNYGEMAPVVTANSTKIVFSWMDNRRSKGWDIYGKVVGWDWDGLTSVLSEDNNPKEFSLLQNYPNPFNPITSINYQLPNSGFVQLKIYDLLGREVATLVDEFKQAGSYVETLHATNLSSGVYIYSLRINGFVKNQKMTLLK